MAEERTPNLFSFATSERSQDAFICWLLAWAKPEYSTLNQPLHDTAVLLLNRLLEASAVTPPTTYSHVEIKQQHKSIDVLVLVNNAIAIVIEDKTHTENHSNQLNRYLDAVRADFPKHTIAASYFKTGDQSNYKAVREAGYAPFLRPDVLAVLRHGIELGLENDIFEDFYRHLCRVEDDVNSYRTLPIQGWEWNAWIGFFKELQTRLKDGEWEYVPNQSRGFMGYWWHSEDDRFLLLEEEKLCFKIWVENETDQSALRNAWHRTLMEAKADSTLAVRKPSRFQKGKAMTAAILEHDYRQADENEVLDMERTVSLLKQAEEFLDVAVQQARLTS